MPQADLVTFHSLIIWTPALIAITYNLSYYFDSPTFWRVRTEYFDQLVDLRNKLKPESFIDQEKIQEFLVDLDAHIKEI